MDQQHKNTQDTQQITHQNNQSVQTHEQISQGTADLTRKPYACSRPNPCDCNQCVSQYMHHIHGSPEAMQQHIQTSIKNCGFAWVGK